MRICKKMEERNKLKGRIHSIESFGTVDGPGVRFVVFFQGCPMRCQYCHNPDTWSLSGGMEMTAEEILEKYDRNKSFYKKGGLTTTGGEALLQLPFLIDLYEKAKKRGIHTCLDTSGIVYSERRKEEFERLFRVTDLVLLDIKHSMPEGHLKLTGQKQNAVIDFAKALEEEKIPMIIRHVVVPGITDSKEELETLGKLIGGFKNLVGLEVLPYHTMGRAKYKNLGIEYPLEGVPDMDKNEAKRAREIILRAIQEKRKN